MYGKPYRKKSDRQNSSKKRQVFDKMEVTGEKEVDFMGQIGASQASPWVSHYISRARGEELNFLVPDSAK